MARFVTPSTDLAEIVARFARESVRLSPATLDRWVRILLSLPATTLSALDAAFVRRYMGDRHAAGLAARTLRVELSAIRALSRWAIRAGLRTDDPTLAVDWPPVPRSHPRGLTRAELRQLVYALEHPPQRRGYSAWQHQRNRVAVLLMLYAGLRLMEAAGLRWSDVDLEDGVLYVVRGKGAKDRAVPLHRDLAAALDTWRPLSRSPVYVLVSRRGRSMSADTIPHIYARWLPSIGIDGCNAHRLRRTCANELRRTGGDLKDIQEVLGHDRPETTDIYLDPDPELVRPAIDRLPAIAEWGQDPPALRVVRGRRRA